MVRKSEPPCSVSLTGQYWKAGVSPCDCKAVTNAQQQKACVCIHTAMQLLRVHI